MLRNVLFLLFLFGIKSCSGNSSNSETQEQIIGSKDVSQNGINKNEIGANGFEVNSENVMRNFRNPVLEYLLHSNSDRANGGGKKGVVREIKHSQTLLMPSFVGSPLPGLLLNQMPQFQSLKKPTEEETRNPNSSPVDNFWNYLKNKTQNNGNKTNENVVSSPVLHLNNDSENKEETKIETYPAVAVVINTFNKDGSLKNSITHFQPDFNSFRPKPNNLGASHVIRGPNANNPISEINNSQNIVKNFMRERDESVFGASSRQGLQWPFANYFPIVINDPFMSFYNAFATSMYNAVSSMVEYGPEADICSKDHLKDIVSEIPKVSPSKPTTRKTNPVVPERYTSEQSDEDIFDEVTMRSESLKKVNKMPLSSLRLTEGFVRKKRDVTSIFVPSRDNDTVAITLEEPSEKNVDTTNTQDDRARSFSQVLVNTPPLSTILRPPQQESRQFLGYADKRKKTKPSKPMKEEGNSEEVGEEQEEESTSQSQENANEAVAISPPPEGASVAEAKPIGLAIAGPGGVAASKPQGTAVAGPGGLAIARPVGTAIAGVDVEGSVPIGGQQKNKKKPKQEQEQTEGELHYVGGLKGPIGNPQPKEFADSIYYKTAKESEGNNIQENYFFRGVPNANGFPLRLGQQNGKYGFIPGFAPPAQEEGRLHKRTDFSTFFHGLLGNDAQAYDQFSKYQTQF